VALKSEKPIGEENSGWGFLKIADKFFLPIFYFLPRPIRLGGYENAVHFLYIRISAF
jgi:hypothetical protein